MMTVALIPGGVIQTAAKIAAGRARPLSGADHDLFKPFSRSENYYSFVSGHTLVAMSISLVLAEQFHSMPVKIALYSLGAIGGLSRVYQDDHWFSDVLLGAALSWACVRSSSNWLNKNKPGGDRKNLSLLFNVTSKQISFSLVW